MRHPGVVIFLVWLLFLITGCGQKGALYLPEIEEGEAITKVEDDTRTDAALN